MIENTFYIYTLGCKVNAYESNAIKKQMLNNGFIYDENDPEIFIINTCSVTSTADQKSRQHIRSFKQKHPQSIVVAMGCYAQKSHKFIFEELKADIVIGNTNKNCVPELIKQFKSNRQPLNLVDVDTLNFKYEEICQTAYSENVRAYLKIQDGCSNFCSYCLIPYVRGKMRSRQFLQIVKEANEIVNQGFKEIVVSGIHIGGYGKDLKDKSFYDVILALSQIEGLKRITISSIEASEIDDNLIELYKKAPNLAHHIHIPLQSGSAHILKAMNRHYDKKEFLKKINLLKRSCPNIAITTDVIVGFPDESDDDFNETIEFIKQAGFAQLHVFPYSIREGTKAAKLNNQIDSKIKKERARILRELSDNLYRDFINRFKGQNVDVLIESYDEKTNMVKGHTSNYIDVSFKGNKDMINQIITVKL